jgi:DNA-binding NarL/FixJ family response regulator
VIACVETAHEAIYHAMEWRIDLLLTNIATPDGDPFKTVREIVRLCPAVKVVYASGYAVPSMCAGALAAKEDFDKASTRDSCSKSTGRKK